MDTEVYLLCPNCKCITDGIGSGDSLDSITCCQCKDVFKASRSIRNYKEYHKKYEAGSLSHAGKGLYIPVDLKILQ